jgi:hypothetical protein
MMAIALASEIIPRIPPEQQFYSLGEIQPEPGIFRYRKWYRQRKLVGCISSGMPHGKHHTAN